MQILIAGHIPDINVRTNGSHIDRAVLRHFDMQITFDAAAASPRNLYLDRNLVPIALEDEFLNIAPQGSSHLNLVP